MTETPAHIYRGGCQCGAIRFEVSERPEKVHLCHCRMCQRAVGNVFAALAPVKKQALTWISEAPAEFDSSPGVSRGFCPQCGTPLTFRRHASPWINLTIGSFDEPHDLRPAFNYGTESRVTWLHDIFDLPDHETAPGGVTGSVDG